jgi:hypothetical protein
MTQETPTPATAAALTQLVFQLATARQRAGTADTAFRDAEARFKSEHQAIVEARDTARAEVAALEDQVRTVAVDVFQLTDEKKPAPGIEVVQETVITYDPGQAFRWAVDHKMGLQLDEKAFAKIAAADPEGLKDVVTISKRAKTKIATDLSKALGAAPAEAAHA